MSESVPVVDFFSSWDNYRAVIDSDAMEHRAIYAAIHEILMERNTPFSLLDLGCGDAAGTGPAMAETLVDHYIGVDIAAPALSFAARTLENSPARIDLRVADIEQALDDSEAGFDVILACFVIHHLQPDAKRAVLAKVLDRLNVGGELILIDLVRQDGWTRADFLTLQDARIRTWPIGSDRQERTVGHANGFDFPEEISTLPRWAQEIGYTAVVEFYRGAEGTQAGWRLLR